MTDTTEHHSDVIQREFAPVVREAFGSDLESIIIYGSYLKETFVPGVSDINVLVLLKQVDASKLAAFGKTAQRVVRRNRIAPLILSTEEFTTSADVFPMEYLDIVTTHKLVHGEDSTLELRLSREHLRHQVEHQLRGHLLSLRQLVVASSARRTSRRALRKELHRWCGSLSAILRGVLRLHAAETIPGSDREIVSQLNKVTGLEPGPITELVESRSGSAIDSRQLILRLVDRLGELVRIVDRMDGGSEVGR
jgi:predicted nucleotidyltransferase